MDSWARGNAPTPWDKDATSSPPVSRGDGTPKSNEELGVAHRQVVAKAYVRSTGQAEEKRWASTARHTAGYVIIGRGFSAVVNLATLLRSEDGRKRLEKLPIYIIGFRDPWLGYKRHEMNQEKEVMTLPGFTNQLGKQALNALHNDRLHKGVTRDIPYTLSDEFADTTDKELRLLLQEGKGAGYSIEILNLFVDKIGFPYGKSEADEKRALIVHMSDQNGVTSTLSAIYVDVCVGPGQSRVLPGEGKYGLKMPEDLRLRYERPPSDAGPVGFPIVCTGSEFTRDNMRTRPGTQVLVQGAGPAAAQAVEEAIRMGASEVLWISSLSFARAFIPNRRVDFLVSTLENNVLKELPQSADRLDLLPDTTEFIPRVEGLWMGKGMKIAEIQWAKQGARVLVTFSDDKIVGTGNEKMTLTNKQAVFDQVVVAQGRENTLKEPGSPTYFIRDIMDKYTFQPISSSGVPHALGVQTPAGQIRFLGAAGLSGAKPASSGTPPNWIETLDEGLFKQLTAYQNSLPAQARVFYQGVTLAAVTIAYANGYFKPDDAKKRNTNRNTALRSECQALSGKGGDDFEARIKSMRVFVEALDGLKANYTPATPVPVPKTV